MSPYASLYDLYNLNVFPYNVDTHTPFPLSLLMTIHKIASVTNWHFSRSFRLIFLYTYEHYPSDLILSSS